MDTVRQTEEARVRQNSSERDAERDREAERPRREQSDRRKHRGTGTVICGEGSRDTHRRRETEKLRDRHINDILLGPGRHSGQPQLTIRGDCDKHPWTKSCLVFV